MAGVETRTVEADDDGIRLDRWFKRHLPAIGFVQLQKLLRSGEIRLDGKRADAGDRLKVGQTLRLPPQVTGPAATAPRPATAARTAPPTAPTAEEAAVLRSRVLHRDAAVIVLDKPAGLAVQGGTETRRHLDGMLDVLRFEAAERPRLVHRLDKDTSGVLALARSAAAAAALTRVFRDRSAEKVYLAILVGVPKRSEGRIEIPLAKRGGAGRERVAADEEDGLTAVTEFRVLDAAARSVCLVEFRPLTGRTHQLRAHAAAIDCPILGDGKYGGTAALLPGSGLVRQLHLHARRLSLPHPTGGRLVAEAPLPPHFLQSLGILGLDPAGR